MQLITIQYFTTEPAAHIAKTRLDSLGIPAFIFNEHSNLIPGVYTLQGGEVELRVMEKDVEMALQILDSLKTPDTLRCIECNSEKIEEVPKTTWLHYLRLFLAGILFLLPQGNRKFRCGNCGLEFKAP